MKEELIKDLKNAIAGSEMGYGFMLLKENIEQFEDFESEIILLESRYKNFVRDRIKGVLDKPGQNTARNQIASSFLQLVQEMENTLKENEKKELNGLVSLNNSLSLKLSDKTKKRIFYKRFRTGEVFELSVSLDMRTRTLRDMLVETIIPEYKDSDYLSSEIGFDLCSLKDNMELDESISLHENGVKEEDTVYLKRYFIYEEEEEEEE